MTSNEPQSGFSHAAWRIISVLRAAIADGASIGSEDLLLALRDDLSRAAEMLNEAGYKPTAEDVLDSPGGQPDPASWLKSLCHEARRLSRESGAVAEAGTEHLLAAVFHVDPGLEASLAARGVDVELLREQREAALGEPAEPLEVDAEALLNIAPASEAAAVNRILDAAANRCREGLRVIEDHVRFSLDDKVLSEELKKIRHELAVTLTHLHAEEWVADRDTRGDVGTTIHTPTERSRRSIDDLLRANCKRVEEALRTLEEFGKLRDSAAAARIEALRYRFYSVEQALTVRRSLRERIAQARLYLLLTDRACPQGLGPVATASMRGGADVIQLREKDVSARRQLELATLLREWTLAAGVLFIVNDRPDLAAIVGADGVHLGQDDLPIAKARRIVGSNALIGVSTHSIEQARQAVLEGADYLGVGPVFTSTTKSFDEFPGLDFVSKVAAEIRMPWFAIGGISADNIGEVTAAGATRVAVSSAICAAADPAGATQELRARLQSDP